MSMILYLKRISDRDVDMLKSRLSKPKEQDGERFHVVDFFFEGGAEDDLVDFDKAWGALNYMFTGETWGTDGPLAIMFYDGEEVGPDDGYGPARLIPATKMKEFSAALEKLSDAELANRYDPKAFAEAGVYSFDNYEDEGDGVLDYVMQSVPDLRRFAKKCVETNSSALVGIY